jgi:hypothetical protein
MHLATVDAEHKSAPASIAASDQKPALQPRSSTRLPASEPPQSRSSGEKKYALRWSFRFTCSGSKIGVRTPSKSNS